MFEAEQKILCASRLKQKPSNATLKVCKVIPEDRTYPVDQRNDKDQRKQVAKKEEDTKIVLHSDPLSLVTEYRTH